MLEPRAVGFYEASRALFAYRDHLRELAADWISFEMLKQPLIIVKDELPQPRHIPPLPENIREALTIIETDIMRLREQFRERDARERETAEKRLRDVEYWKAKGKR